MANYETLCPLRSLSQGQSQNRQDNFKVQGSIYWFAGLCVFILALVPQGPEICNQFLELWVPDDGRSPPFPHFTTKKHLRRFVVAVKQAQVTDFHLKSRSFAYAAE